MGFVKKATLLGVSEIFLALGGLVSSVIYSRYLGPDGVGQFSVFLSTATIAVPLVSLGIGRANIYFLNSGRFSRREVVSQSTVVGLIAAVIVLVGMTLFLHQRSNFYGTFSWGVLLAFSFGLGCQVAISLLRPVLVAAIATRHILSVDLLQRLVVILTALALALSGRLTVGMALCISALGASAAVLLLLFFLRDDLRPMSPLLTMEWFRETTAYGLKMAASGILFALTSSATVLIIRHRLPEEFASIGFYTRAVAISGFAVLIPRALSPLFYAKWSEGTGTDRVVQIERAARFNVLYGVLSAIGLVLLGKYAVLILYGPEFLPAYDVLIVFAPAMVFVCLFSVFNSLLSSDGRAAAVAKILGVTMIIVCTLTYLTVPYMGIFGAAMAVLCGNACSTFLIAASCLPDYDLRIRRMLVIQPEDFRYLLQALTR